VDYVDWADVDYRNSSFFGGTYHWVVSRLCSSQVLRLLLRSEQPTLMTATLMDKTCSDTHKKVRKGDGHETVGNVRSRIHFFNRTQVQSVTFRYVASGCVTLHYFP
jgi:hypothetical protein